MKKSTRPTAPNNLSTEAKQWWRQIVEEFEIDDQAGLLLLRTAMESLDRMREAQAILSTDGVVITDRFGQKRQHPATLIERDAKNMMLRSLKSMNLDIQPGTPLKGNQ